MNPLPFESYKVAFCYLPPLLARLFTKVRANGQAIRTRLGQR